MNANTALSTVLSSAFAAALLVASLTQSMAGPIDVRSIDGTGNNLLNPDFGVANTPLIRISPADYPGDGSGATMIGPPERENPRVISNTLAAQGTALIPNHRNLSDFVWQWGQFVDHDIDLTMGGHANGTAPIDMTNPGDPLGPQPIPFVRSDFEPATGTASDPREQMNTITAYIDASNVYGSDPATAASLRTFSDGRLATSAGALLPVDADGFFMAGDVRANEQVGLTAMHTLFLREHNRLADALVAQQQGATDEEVYQTARKIVGAQMQIITYGEFLPALLGPHAPSALDFAYDPNTNASIANEFSTAAYRFGHSMLAPQLKLVDPIDATLSSISLRDAFFNPGFFLDEPDNIERVLVGLASQKAQEVDNKLVDDVRNFLFGPPGAGGLDLAALNLQRGRDHGIPDYNTLRAAYGLDPVLGFDQISSDPELQQILENLYASVDNIDAWVGGLAEDHLTGASVGEFVATAIIDQFTRLRDGDRFFYLNDSSLRSENIQAIIDLDDVSLAHIIKLNTTIDDLHHDVFSVPAPEPLTLHLLAVGIAGMVLLGRPATRRS